MSVAEADAVAAENWDDDFQFQDTTSGSTGSRRQATKSLAGPSPPNQINTFASSLSLHHWTEPGPSTPSKSHKNEDESWDDDFPDKSDSPTRRRTADTSPRSVRLRRRQLGQHAETENWDDDFEIGHPTSPSKQSTKWDSSDEDDFGFADREEDRTVTSRTRRGTLPTILPNGTPPPPVPPIPSAFMPVIDGGEPAPFPRSPTASVFSVPVSGRDSVAGHSYSSTAHLALRPTISGSSFGALPPSPPIHHARERRRLRKKSRPARVDDNIYELEDRAVIEPALPLRPITPPAQMITSLDEPVPEATPHTNRSSLVSRIGSVGKKWGTSRKKRASMGPADTSVTDRSASGEENSARPQSVAIPSSPPASKSGWFFHRGGATGAGSGSPPSQQMTLPLKHEKSVDRLLSLVGIDPDTPSKRKQKIRQVLPTDLTDRSSPSSLVSGSPRRPTSLQVSSSSRSSSRPRGARHASYGQTQSGRHTPSSRSSSVARSASASVDDLSHRHHHIPLPPLPDETMTPRKGRTSEDYEPGHRSIVGGMRRVSLRSKHKRSQSNMTGQETSGSMRASTSTEKTAVPALAQDFSNDNTPRPPSRVMPRRSTDKSLLPPIELQPPSPPREFVLTTPISEPASGSLGIDSLLAPVLSSSQSVPAANLASILSKSPASQQQSASLGRATQLAKEKEDCGAPVPRRNSLGDLKIPARISQAQMGLRRDLGMVREFARSVDQLKDVQATHNDLVVDLQNLLLKMAPEDKPKERAMSPTFFGIPRPGRARSSTNPQDSDRSHRALNHRQLSTAFWAIEAKYRISWECAELLVELGGGAPATNTMSPSSAPSLEQSYSTFQPSYPMLSDSRKSRERAITLAGDESKPPPLLVKPVTSATSRNDGSDWRASTGRHDLSQRQLLLLRDMLTNPDSSANISTEGNIPEEFVNRTWHWGDGMTSTLTLPSEESSRLDLNPEAKATVSGKKRKLGMRGLRDMLKSLRKSYSQPRSIVRDEADQTDAGSPPSIPPSYTSISLGTESSLHIPRERPQSVVQRRRAKTSVGPESVRSLRDTHPNSPYVTSTSLQHRSSPRRPSLASIFKIGQRHNKSGTSKSAHSSSADHSIEGVDRLGSSSSCQISESAATHAATEEEDWDKVESSSDLEAAALGLLQGETTVRNKSNRRPQTADSHSSSPIPSTPSTRMANASQTSLTDPPTRGQAAASHSFGNVPVNLPPRTTKLSDVREQVEKEGGGRRLARDSRQSFSNPNSKRRSSAGPSPSPKRRTSRSGRRNAGPTTPAGPMPSASPGPAHNHAHAYDAQELSTTFLADNRLALAMTPDNIGPLLENTKEVYQQCTECIIALTQLLEASPKAG